MSRGKLGFIETADSNKPSVLKKIVRYTCDSDPEVRMRAVEWLSEERSLSGPEIFLNLCGDPDELVRVEALQALSVRKYASRFAPVFIGCLNDKSELVAAYAADGLRVAKRKSTRVMLERHLASSRGIVHASVLGALHEIGRPRSLAALVRLLRSSDYHVICFVANLLPTLRMTRREARSCVRALEAVGLRHKVVAVRDSVSKALSQLEQLNSRA